MSEDTLTPVDPTPDEVQFLEDRIYEFNSSVTEITDHRNLLMRKRLRPLS
jgi:hypothetical protein